MADRDLWLTCCDSVIVSPIRLVRNVPLSLRPRRSWIGTDSDEHRRAEAGGGVGASGGGDLDVGIGGDVDGRELPAGEAAVCPLSSPGRGGPAAWERGAGVQSGDVDPSSETG